MDNTGIIRNLISSRTSALNLILATPEIVETISEITGLMTECYRSGGKVLFCGNGGSAADAQHLAAELSGRFYLDRKPLPAMALHVNTSHLTAVANDLSFDEVYARLVEAHGKKGDILVALSTSGNSKNILRAVEEGNRAELVTIGFTGIGGGKLAGKTKLTVRVPSEDTPVIQEMHIMAGHIICQIVEKNLFGNG